MKPWIYDVNQGSGATINNNEVVCFVYCDNTSNTTTLTVRYDFNVTFTDLV